MSQESQVYECTGCGRLAADPEADLIDIQASGGMTCCPERHIQRRAFHAATLRQQAARVDAGMVSRAVEAWNAAPALGREEDDANAMRAALEAALSAQPAPEFDARKYVRQLADLLEEGAGLWKVDADLTRLGAAIQKATSAQPAPERQGAALSELRQLWPRWRQLVDGFVDSEHWNTGWDAETRQSMIDWGLKWIADAQEVRHG